MAKNSLYKKLVRKFESTINNYQAVNSEFDFTKIEKIILNQKKNNRYYRGIEQFLVYLRKFKDKNELNFISNKSREKYKRSSENLESLLIATLLEKETRLSVTAVKKSNLMSLVIQPFLSTFLFLQLFTKQIITARPLEARRYTRQTNNCEYPKGAQCNKNLDMKVYQDDLQKSVGFSALLKRKQSMEFHFKDTIFILSENCLSRQSLEKKPQSLCHSDYGWFLQSMAIYHIRKKICAEAQKQGLSLNETDVAQITRELCRIEASEQIERKLVGIFSKGDIIKKISESKLEQFFFNAEYLANEFKSTFPEGNNNNLVSDVNEAVTLKITALKNSHQKTEIGFASHLTPDNSQALPENHSIISNATSSISQRSVDRSSEGFNWMIIAAAAGGIGIVFIVVMVIWYSKKSRSENAGLTTEGIPLLNSITDNLHVQKIAIRLDKRLESLKELDRYKDEIGVHYTSFLKIKSKEDAIKELKKIQEALTKFLRPLSHSNAAEDRIKSNKLESALLIIESLIQRYSLLSLPNPNPNSSENNYITLQLKSGLKDSINSMLDNIEIIRSNFEETFFTKHKLKKDKSKLIYLDLLLNSEKAIYETMLSAHAEGYFEKYPPGQIKNCLNLNINTNPVINTQIDLKSIKELQGDLLSSLGFILNPSKALEKDLLKLQEDELCNAINAFITKLECIKSQLIAYFADYNARCDLATKLEQTQTPIESGNSTFFVQTKSPKKTNLSRKFTM